MRILFSFRHSNFVRRIPSVVLCQVVILLLRASIHFVTGDSLVIHFLCVWCGFHNPIMLSNSFSFQYHYLFTYYLISFQFHWNETNTILFNNLRFFFILFSFRKHFLEVFSFVLILQLNHFIFWLDKSLIQSRCRSSFSWVVSWLPRRQLYVYLSKQTIYMIQIWNYLNQIHKKN